MALWWLLVSFVINKAFILCDTGKPRNFPLCLTDELFTEYAADLPEGIRFKAFISEKATRDRDVKHAQSNCVTCGVGNVHKIWWGKIKTNFQPAEYETIQYLRQWIHLHITTTVKVQGIIVQAVTNPFGMAYGNFDLEFACKDCGEDIKLSDALEGSALGLGDKAAALPCRRRTYLHVRHPYVYAYASSTDSRSSFHMNYNYLDIPCRETTMIQLMIMTVPDFTQVSADYVFSGVVDHYSVQGRSITNFYVNAIFGLVPDSLDGMPYPYHVSMHDKMTCHEEDFSFNPVPASNGIPYSIPYNELYDSCTIASESIFTSVYKETTNYFSRYVCKNPTPTRCEFSEKSKKSGTLQGRSVISSPPDCQKCTLKKNYYTVKAFFRLVPTVYSARRMHGLLLIFGMVVAPGASIHVARYLKETKRGCFLVGWWLWVHAFLTVASKCAVWIGLALATTLPPRTEGFGVALDTIYKSRGSIITSHKYIGGFAAVAYHVGCVTGPFRCQSSAKKLAIYVHFLFGYISVVLGLISVIFSTTCFNDILLTILLVAVQILAWILAMGLQFLMDRENALTPPRKLLPVIEAVVVPSMMPKMIIRLIILIVLILCQVIFFLLIVLFTYKGLFKPNPCANCKWKYDEFIFGKGMIASSPMHLVYSCDLDYQTWKDL